LKKKYPFKPRLPQRQFNRAIHLISTTSTPISRIIKDLSLTDEQFYQCAASSANNSRALVSARTARASVDAQTIADLAREMVQESKNQDPKRAMAVTQAYKNQIDTYKWLMAAHAPKQYGEKTGVEVSGSVSTVFRLPAKLPQGASLSGRASPGAAAVQDRATTGGIPEHSVNDKKLLSSVNAENT